MLKKAVTLALTTAGLLLMATGCVPAGPGGSAGPDPTEGTGATSAAVESPIDGVYRWSTTEEQAIGTPAEEGIGTVWPKDAIASVPNTFTMTLDDGAFSWQGTATPQVDSGSYTVQDDTLELTWDPPVTWVLAFTYTADDDGTLHLTPKGDFDDPVNEFVFTLNPWTKIG